jgi:hypothetical protein
MEFADLEPLRDRTPLIHLTIGDRKIDLHNDCELLSFEYDLTHQRFWLRFASSSRVSHIEGTLTALIILVFDGVDRLGFSGTVLRSQVGDPVGLDFMEFTRSASRGGQLRLVFDADFEIEIEAARMSASLVRR